VKSRSLILLIPLALALAGCSGIGGTKHYSCPGKPSQPLCRSVPELYRASNGPGLLR